MVNAVVLYDYVAQEPDELTIHKGELIYDVQMIEAGWWEGTLSAGKRGMFPDNFVVLIDETEPPSKGLFKFPADARYCRADFHYRAVHEDELSLKAGDVIEILDEIEEGWWKGRVVETDVEGAFPSNFVTLIQDFTKPPPINLNSHPKAKSLLPTSLTMTTSVTVKSTSQVKMTSKEDLSKSLDHIDDIVAPTLPPKPEKTYCLVQFPYPARNDDELDLQVGDIITLISKDSQDTGWWRGELNGAIGVFPDNFVTIVNPSNNVDVQQRKRRSFSLSKESDNDTQPSTDIKSNVTIKTENFLRNESKDTSKSHIAAHRKSLDPVASNVGSTANVTSSGPPIPSKKPNIPLKKSPSPSSGVGGILSGFRQKLLDMEQKIVSSTDSHDGGAASRIRKSPSPVPTQASPRASSLDADPSTKPTDFDKVERSGLLSDMRLNRAKAPGGRRPPSVVFREGGDNLANGLTNGTNDHPVVLPRSPPIEEIPASNRLSQKTTSSPNLLDEDAEIKPKKTDQKVPPWMGELKLSQARRSTASISPSPQERKTPDSDLKDEDGKTDSFKSSTSLLSRVSSENLQTSLNQSSISSTSLRMRTPTPEPLEVKNIRSNTGSNDSLSPLCSPIINQDDSYEEVKPPVEQTKPTVALRSPLRHNYDDVKLNDRAKVINENGIKPIKRFDVGNSKRCNSLLLTQAEIQNGVVSCAKFNHLVDICHGLEKKIDEMSELHRREISELRLSIDKLSEKISSIV